MGKYIYQGHMGGLYATHQEQPWDMLYCEQCGDSDHLIGHANNLAEAWALLESETDTCDITKCDNCPHDEDYDYCNEHCEEYAKSGGYGLPYVMEFLKEEFPNDTKWHYIYLLLKHKEDDKEYYMARCNHDNYKFGEKHSFPVAVSMNKEYADMIARSLTIYGGEVDVSTLKCITTKHTKKSIIHIYECIDTKPESENWREAASYFGDGWYGYFDRDSLNLVDEQELVFCDIFINEKEKEN